MTMNEITIAAHRDALAKKLEAIRKIIDSDELCAEAMVSEIAEILYREGVC